MNMSEPSSTQTESATAIRVEGLGKTFPDGAQALQAVDFSLFAGELCALIGENGSGKSTLLKILFGALRADEGRVGVFDCDPRVDGAAVRRRTGFAEQDPILDPEMTGWETLRLFYALRGLAHRSRQPRLAELVEEYNLGAFCHRRIARYSGGQRQRLHLAVETMHDPRLLLLDEPTASLDPDGRRDFWRRLVQWRDAGHTILVATHDLSDVSAHCDRLLLFQGGRLLAADTPAAVAAAHSRSRAVIELWKAPLDTESLRRELSGLAGVTDVNIDDRRVTLWRDRPPEHGELAFDVLAARGVGFRSYEQQEPDLASAYFRLTGGA